jgi:hypothetical protein
MSTFTRIQFSSALQGTAVMPYHPSRQGFMRHTGNEPADIGIAARFQSRYWLERIMYYI